MFKTFLIRLSLFVAFFWVFDKLFIWVRNRAPELEVDKKLEWVLQGRFQHDIIIMGSSCGARGIYARQLSDSLNCRAYNLASPGSDIDYQHFVLQQFVSNGNKLPRLFVLALDEPAGFYADKIVNFRYDRLYPLVCYPQIRQTMIERGEKNKWLSNLFVLYQLNKTNLDLRQRHFTPNDTIMPCGSMPARVYNVSFPGKYYNGNKPYDRQKELSYKVDKFNAIVRICDSLKVPLLLTLPPRFHSRNYFYEQRILELVKNKPLVYFYGYNEKQEEFRQKAFFGDAVHVNFKGAQLFTSGLSTFIRENKLLEKKLNKQ